MQGAWLMGYVPPDDKTSNFWYPHRPPCCQHREQSDGFGFMVTSAIIALGFVCFMLGMWIGESHVWHEQPSPEVEAPK